MGFSTVLGKVIFMLAFMAMGFVLVKTRVAKPEHGKTIASFLLYCATPSMFLSSFNEMDYTPESGLNLLYFFLFSLAIQLLMMLILWLILHKRLDDGKYRILIIGAYMGNVGFFGQPVIHSLFPGNALASCYSMMFATSMNVLLFTVGEFMVTQDKRFISIRKTIINPTILTLLVAIPLYLLKIKLPSGIYNLTYTMRSMSAPLCMFVLGLRLASMSLREVFAEPFAYLVSSMKLVAFPLLTYLVLLLFPGIDQTFKVSMVILAGCPCASMILALAEMHDCEQKHAAYTVLISAILCVITLPLLTLLA
ncbi:MAG: AEC family transporter [Spirochaetales bacterium]|nr:AEC family transporter [Spirochaetales bacterium]